MAVVRVLLVDDQAAFLRAMASVLRETPGHDPEVGDADLALPASNPLVPAAGTSA